MTSSDGNSGPPNLKGVLAIVAPPIGQASPQLQAAAALGWHVSEIQLVEPDSLPGSAGSGSGSWPPPELPKISQLRTAEVMKILEAQVASDIAKLKKLGVDIGNLDPSALGEYVPPPKQARGTSVGPSTTATTLAMAVPPDASPPEPLDPISVPTPAATPSIVERFHSDCLTELMAADSQLAYGYLLGVDLGDCVMRTYKRIVVLQEAPAATALKSVLAPRAESLKRGVRELKQGLGDHVAEAVAVSITDWTSWADADCKQDSAALALTDKQIGNLFYRQGSIWRTLITGERQPTDYLVLRDYLRAASAIIQDYATLARQLLSKPLTEVALGILCAFVVGVVIVTGVTHSSPITPVITILSAFGVSGAGLGAGFKRLLDEAEAILWHSEIGATVAQATNCLPAGVARRATQAVADRSL